MSTTVIVDNVDISLLKDQRDAVIDSIKMVECVEGPRRTVAEHVKALDGLVNFLDHILDAEHNITHSE